MSGMSFIWREETYLAGSLDTRPSYWPLIYMDYEMKRGPNFDLERMSYIVSQTDSVIFALDWNKLENSSLFQKVNWDFMGLT